MENQHAWYQLSLDERTEMQERITAGEVSADEDARRDSFAFALEGSGRTVSGSYSWDAADPTEWNVEIS